MLIVSVRPLNLLETRCWSSRNLFEYSKAERDALPNGEAVEYGPCSTLFLGWLLLHFMACSPNNAGDRVMASLIRIREEALSDLAEQTECYNFLGIWLRLAASSVTASMGSAWLQPSPAS